MSVEVSLRTLADKLGDEYILSPQDSSFEYLAAMALETSEQSSYEVDDVILEFIRNSQEFEHLNGQDIGTIEEVLRQ
jgi:hypothetical protein